MIKDFEFEDAGIKFSCTVEAPSREGMPPWWFFQLDTRGSNRYAPFAASPSDTRESVKKRIIAYYAEMLATEARPAYQRPSWNKPAKPAAPADGAAPAAESTPAKA